MYFIAYRIIFILYTTNISAPAGPLSVRAISPIDAASVCVCVRIRARAQNFNDEKKSDSEVKKKVDKGERNVLLNTCREGKGGT